MKSKRFNAVISETPAEVRAHIKFCMDVTDRLHELLLLKFDGKQKLLAEKMGKSEAEVSKWFSGIQNFTTKTLTKLSVAFGEPIIVVCTHEADEHAIFEQVKVPYSKKATELQIDIIGRLHPVEKLHKESEIMPYIKSIEHVIGLQSSKYA